MLNTRGGGCTKNTPALKDTEGVHLRIPPPSLKKKGPLPQMNTTPIRADRSGPHRVAFEKNKKIILKTRNTCGICGQPVDKDLRYPHPLSPVIDHIVPVNKNGHPSDIANLQLAHWQCNRQKSDKLYADEKTNGTKVIGNRNLPQSTDWFKYKS